PDLKPVESIFQRPSYRRLIAPDGPNGRSKQGIADRQVDVVRNNVDIERRAQDTNHWSSRGNDLPVPDSLDDDGVCGVCSGIGNAGNEPARIVDRQAWHHSRGGSSVFDAVIIAFCS